LGIPKEVREAISAWNIGKVQTSELAKRGVVNRNLILGTPSGKYVLRQVSHTHHKSPRDLEFELAYLDYLKRASFPYEIPSAMPTTKGRLFVAVRGHYYWLYEFLEGIFVDKLDEPRLRKLAEMMAAYHRLIEESGLNNGKPVSDLYNKAATLREIAQYRSEILRKNKRDQKEIIFLEESAKAIEVLRHFDDLPQPRVGLYPIHRDLNSENLIWKEAGLSGVIDFEHVSESNDPVVKDLAVTMQYSCRDSRFRHQLDIDSANRFLDEYTHYHPLPDKEIELIPDLMTAGFLEDFVYAFWMVRNDPDRAKQSEKDGYGLTLFSKAAEWSNQNRERVSQAFSK
jgi:Ser/Thr protein kinase RdoA (MazF antagonist)